jgi:hypothetical protein
MHIQSRNQPTPKALRRLFIAATSTVRTLLAYAQAADWNGRTLTALLLSTWLCGFFDGK